MFNDALSNSYHTAWYISIIREEILEIISNYGMAEA
jgi:hypothetical protein